MPASKKLFRSSTDKMLAGVCGGIAKYFEVDSSIVRLVALVFLFMSEGTFFLAYLILAIIVPLDSSERSQGIDLKESKNKITQDLKTVDWNLFAGLGLLFIGIAIMINTYIPAWGLIIRFTLSGLLIVCGLYIIANQIGGKNDRKK